MVDPNHWESLHPPALTLNVVNLFPQTHTSLHSCLAFTWNPHDQHASYPNMHTFQRLAFDSHPTYSVIHIHVVFQIPFLIHTNSIQTLDLTYLSTWLDLHYLVTINLGHHILTRFAMLWSLVILQFL